MSILRVGLCKGLCQQKSDESVPQGQGPLALFMNSSFSAVRLFTESNNMTGPRATASAKQEDPPLSTSEFRKCMEKFENKLDNFNQVDAKFQDLNVYIDGEVTKLVSRIEKNSSNINKIISQDSVTPPSPLECIEKCIVISGLVFAPQEDLPYKIATMLDKIDCGSVILEDAKRMGNAPNPLVKVAMSRSDKAMVLSKKGRLRNVAGYGRVYIRTSKTMEARAMETNMRTIANLFPQLSFMNGRLVPRVEGQQHMQQSAVYPPYQMQPAYHQPYQAQGYAQSNFRFAQSNQQAQRPVPTPSQGQQPASQDQRIQLASQDL